VAESPLGVLAEDFSPVESFVLLKGARALMGTNGLTLIELGEGSPTARAGDPRPETNGGQSDRDKGGSSWAWLFNKWLLLYLLPGLLVLFAQLQKFHKDEAEGWSGSIRAEAIQRRGSLTPMDAIPT
jgi:hypothetical protein